MNYELAKQLKDVGFPQPHPLIGTLEIFNGEQIYIPTLSELIEVCGRDFSELRYSNKKHHGLDEIWRAYALIPGDINAGRERPRGTGSTPEEAVARLWLTLHNK